MSRRRRILARSLVVLGALVAVLALLAGYIRYQVLDEDTFSDTAGELIANDAIRDQIALSLVDEVFTSVDVEDAVEDDLPTDQRGLAPALAGAAQALAERAAPEILARPRVQKIWTESVIRTHAQLLALLNDESTAISTEGGVVVLDLRPLIVQVGEQVAIVGRIASRLPEGEGVITIMEADQLESAQDLTGLLDTVGLWLWVVPILLWATAIAIARGRRRIELRAVALSAIVVGLLVLVIRRVAGTYIVDNLVEAETAKPAVQDAWEILTALLKDGAWTVIGVGVVLLVGVWLAGGSTSGIAVRRGLAPFLVRPAWAYGFVVAFILLLAWWGRPTRRGGRSSFWPHSSSSPSASRPFAGSRCAISPTRRRLRRATPSSTPAPASRRVYSQPTPSPSPSRR